MTSRLGLRAAHPPCPSCLRSHHHTDARHTERVALHEKRVRRCSRKRLKNRRGRDADEKDEEGEKWERQGREQDGSEEKEGGEKRLRPATRAWCWSCRKRWNRSMSPNLSLLRNPQFNRPQPTSNHPGPTFNRPQSTPNRPQPRPIKVSAGLCRS